MTKQYLIKGSASLPTPIEEPIDTSGYRVKKSGKYWKVQYKSNWLWWNDVQLEEEFWFFPYWTRASYITEEAAHKAMQFFAKNKYRKPK